MKKREKTRAVQTPYVLVNRWVRVENQKIKFASIVPKTKKKQFRVASSSDSSHLRSVHFSFTAHAADAPFGNSFLKKGKSACSDYAWWRESCTFFAAGHICAFCRLFLSWVAERQEKKFILALGIINGENEEKGEEEKFEMQVIQIHICRSVLVRLLRAAAFEEKKNTNMNKSIFNDNEIILLIEIPKKVFKCKKRKGNDGAVISPQAPIRAASAPVYACRACVKSWTG